MQNPLVSIIIPTYNRAHLIGETLDSVIAQTYTNWECIVVDDGSTDTTDEVLKKYCDKDSRIQYHHRPADRLPGGNAARNYGFELSKGEYIQFLDSDDLLENFCLKKRCEKVLLETDNNTLFIYSMGLLISNKKTDKIYNQDFDENKLFLKNFISTNSPWTITCIFWDRERFIEIGMFDERFERLQDIDLHTRLLLKFNVNIERIDTVDTWYRILDKNYEYCTKERLSKIIKAHLLFIEKYFSKIESDRITFEEVNQILRELFLKTFYKYVFKENVVCFKEMMHLNKFCNLLNHKKYFFIWCLYFYHFIGINSLKYIGYNKIRKYAFS